MTTTDRRMGAHLGLAVGDALRAAIESRPPGIVEFQRLRHADTVRGDRRSPENDVRVQFTLNWKEP